MDFDDFLQNHCIIITKTHLFLCDHGDGQSEKFEWIFLFFKSMI